MPVRLVGQNYTTPDLVAKVTGRARYAEDFRAEGMLFCKLLLSPMPHCRILAIDASAALAMPGVKAILTADDMPAVKPAAEGGLAPEVALTNEPVYQGEPVLAIAAVDEGTAAEAIESVVVDVEPLPFVVDPIASLRPGGANARLQGNAFVDGKIATVKWPADDFAAAGDGALPMGDSGTRWEYGDVDAGFAAAALVLDETFHTNATGHEPLETRTAMAYWQNGKLYLHGSTQSVAQTVESVARWTGVEASQVVVVSEYTGGGFGSKIPGAHSMAIPALLAKKAGAPVMMRISREEEHYIGRTRPNLLGRVKAGFGKDGRITAIDLYVVQDAGPYEDQDDLISAPGICSLAYQPLAMRFRGISVLTNNPPRTSQRSPGGMQQNAILEPVLAKAARQLGIDTVELHKVNAPAGKAPLGPPGKEGKRSYVTSAFVREALDKGAELFNWAGTQAAEPAAARRGGARSRRGGEPLHRRLLDQLRRPADDPARRAAVGAVGGGQPRHSLCDRHGARAGPDPRRAVGQGRRRLGRHQQAPAVDLHVGRQPDDPRDDPRQPCGGTRRDRQAAGDRRGGSGGRPEDYEVGGERVYRRGAPGRGLTFAQAATRAIALGGRYDGHQLPDDIHAMTKASATALAGVGLMGVAKDTYPHDGETHSYVVGFAEVEVDVETGVVRLIEYTAVADVGTVINPRSLGGQILGGSCLGIGHALCQRSTYDQQYGVALARRFHHTRPLTIMDIPATGMHQAALDLADPDTPVGARGVGEPPVGAGYGAVLAAIADAVGDDVFRRAPVTPDLILTALEAGRRTHDVITSHI